MTWTPYNSQGFESAKIWPRVVEYAAGVGLDIGCGLQKCMPHMIGVDADPACRPDIVAAADELTMFADESLDFIFSSHYLEHVHPDQVFDLLMYWRRKLKVGGNLILYLPNNDDYPKMGQEGSNPDHKWNVYPGAVYAALDEQCGAHLAGWLQIEDEVRDEGNEYSLFEVYRKTTEAGMRKQLWAGRALYKKRAIVLRYGAIGDTLVAASVLPGLKKQGYYITFLCNEVGEELLRHHPMIDELIVQTMEMVPPNMGIPFYGSFHTEGRYDLVVNLNHSLEVTCLGHKDSVNQFWSHEGRRKIFGRRNYLETAHDLADLSYDFEPAFYETPEEVSWASEGRAAVDGPVVLWQLAGSSVNKIYPFTDTVVKWLTEAGIVVIFTGGKGNDEKLQDVITELLYLDGADTEMVAPRCGKWSIRKGIAMAKQVDCVVGPETGMLNAVALDAVPKVIYLSHSAEANLTKHWRNTTVLTPPAEACPCYPCHRIHESFETCHEVEETKAALCASEIKPEWVYQAIKDALANHAQIARAAE